MRGALAWILAILAGLGVVLVVTAAIGGRNKSGETVSAGQWAQSVCGAVGTWRGELKAVAKDIRNPPGNGVSGTQEPQSQTPQGGSGSVRNGLQESVRATKTMVDGIKRSGVPDTAHGKEAAAQVTDWADSASSDLEAAQNSLDQKAGTVEGSIGQITTAAQAIAVTLTSGVKTLVGVAKLDPELAQAFSASSTCQQLRKEQSKP